MLLPTTLPRYVFGQALFATLVAAVGLLALVWLLQSLRFLDFLVNKGLGLGVFLEITSLLIPRLLVIILPLAMLAGAIYTCRKLQDDHETTALLAGGLRPYIAIAPLLGVGVLVGAALLTIMLWLQPATTTAFKDLQNNLRLKQGQLLLETGTFNPLGDDLMVYVKERLTPTSFAQLLVHDTRDPTRPITWYAKQGELRTNPTTQAPELLLQQGLRQEAGPREVTMLEFSSYNLSLASQLTQAMAGPREPEVEEFKWQNLWAAASQPGISAKRAMRLKAEAAHRLGWPVLPVPLVLVAVAGLLHPPKRKQGSLHGVLLAAVAGIGIVGAQFGILTQAQSGAAWALAGLLSWPVLAAVFALVWFQRASRP